jgi:hypothetical protein
MPPAIRRMTVRIKELYDAKEQEFFGAQSLADGGFYLQTAQPAGSLSV